MGAESKEVRIKIVVDQGDARKAESIMKDLTRAVQNLNQMLARTSFGGTGSGTIKPAATGGGAPGSKSQVGLLPTLLGGSTTELRAMGQGAAATFQAVSSSVRGFVDKTDGDLKKLRGSIRDTMRDMQSLGGTPTGGHGGVFGNAPTLPGGQLGGFNMGIGGSSWGGPGPGPFPSGGAPTGPGFLSRAWGWAKGNPNLFGGGGGGGGRGGGGGFGGALGGLASQFGIPFLGGGLSAGAAIGAYSYAVGAMEDEQNARLKYQIGEPIERMSRRGQVAAPFVQQFGRAWGGDVAGSVAYTRAMARPEVKAAIQNTLVQRAMLASRQSGAGSIRLGAFAKGVSGYAGQATEGFMGSITSPGGGGKLLGALGGMLGGNFGAMGSLFDNHRTLTPGESRRAIELAEDQALRNVSAEQAAAIQKAQAAEREVMDPLTATLANQVYQGAMGRTQALRSAGISSGFTKLPNGSLRSTYENLESKLMRGGWGVGDYASGHQQLLGIGAGYSSAIGPIGLVGAGIAGLHNAGQLVQGAAILGGGVGAGRDFYKNTVQKSIGQGGLDVAVGRDFFGSELGRMRASGQFGSSGAGTYLGAMAGLIGGGAGAPLDVAQQQRNAAGIEMGMQLAGSFSTGRRAPLYQATSILAATSAMGGYSTGAEKLSQMDPRLLTSIVRGGKIPAAYQGLNITQEAASKFLNFQRRAPLLEVIDENVKGKTGEMLSKVRGFEARGGSWVDYVDDVTQGMKGKQKAKFAQSIAGQLGLLVSDNAEEGRGLLMSQLAQKEGYAPFLKGKGVHAAGPGGLEKEALKDQADKTMKAAEEIAKSVKALVERGGFKLVDQVDPARAGVDGAAKGGGDDTSVAIGDLIGALQRFDSTLRNGKGKSGPTKAGPRAGVGQR